MNRFWTTAVMAGVVGMAGLASAQNGAPAAAPVAGTVVFGFEDDAWKAAKFQTENVAGGGASVVAENATEGAKALMIEIDQTGKTESARPVLRINKPTAFSGAKKIMFDYTLVGEVAAKTKIRVKVQDTAKGEASNEQLLSAGKDTMTVNLGSVDSAKLLSIKISIDNCKTGKAKLYFDNFRMEK